MSLVAQVNEIKLLFEEINHSGISEPLFNRYSTVWSALYQHEEFGRLTQGEMADLLLKSAEINFLFFERYRDENARESAFKQLQEICSLYPESDINHVLSLGNLASAQMRTYALIGDSYLNAAINNLEGALALCQGMMQKTLPLFSKLGVCLHDRYIANRNQEDLARSISLHTMTVNETSDRDALLPTYLSNLGVALSERYTQTGAIEDLNKAIDCFERALALAPEGLQSATYFNNLADSLCDRYRAGSKDDLARAIDLVKKALVLTPKDRPEFPGYLMNLGNYLRMNYYESRDSRILDQALKAYQEAAGRTNGNSPDHNDIIHNMGHGYRTRYFHTGDFEDLQQAIAAFQKAATPSRFETSRAIIYANSFATGLLDRYNALGKPGDLNEAIDIYRRVVAATPKGSPDYPRHLNNLGNGLRDRYSREGKLTDLKESITLYEMAIEASPPQALERPSRLNNLANSLRDLYNKTHDKADLDRALETYQQAEKGLATYSEHHPELAEIRNGYGNALRDRFFYDQDEKSLDLAVEAYERAARSATATGPGAASYLQNLAATLCDWERITPSPDRAKKIYRLFRKAVSLSKKRAVYHAMTAASGWLAWAFEQRNWPEVMAAYRRGQRIFKRMYAVQLLRSDKEFALSRFAHFSERAAYAFAQMGHPAQAALALERGQALMTNEALAFGQTRLKRLSSQGHGHLYKRFLKLASRWRWLQMYPTNTPQSRSRLERNQRELDKVLAKIRSLKGYGQFFRQPSIRDLQRVSERIPILYMSVTEAGGLAILVTDEITCRFLPDLKLEGLNRSLLGTADDVGYFKAFQEFHDETRNQKRERAFGEALVKLQNTLWEVAVHPILEWLVTHPRLCLVPVGLLNLLPILAACPAHGNDSEAQQLFDGERCHAPNALVLGNSLRKEKQGENFLAVSTTKPTDDDHLAYATLEAPILSGFFADTTILTQDQASKKVVLNSLSKAHWAHFACHGMADTEDPLSSRLVLNNGDLTLRDILQHQPGQLHFVSLAACETALTGTTLPSEHIGLPSGFLSAGVACVLATLWPVADDATFFFMYKFFQCHREQGLTPLAAFKTTRLWLKDVEVGALRSIMRTLTAKLDGPEKSIAASDWWPLEESDYRPFRHPIHWAAFQLVGC